MPELVDKKEPPIITKIKKINDRFCGALSREIPMLDMLLVSDKNIELNVIEPGIPFEPIPELYVEPILVQHREDFTDTFAFRITGEQQTILFAPDMDSLNCVEQLLEGVDVAYLDGTFYDKNELKNRSIKNVPHPSIIESMELFKNLDNNNKNKIYFTHLNHTNKLLQIDSSEYKKTLSKHFNILNDKMVFNI